MTPVINTRIVTVADLEAAEIHLTRFYRNGEQNCLFDCRCADGSGPGRTPWVFRAAYGRQTGVDIENGIELLSRIPRLTQIPEVGGYCPNFSDRLETVAHLFKDNAVLDHMIHVGRRTGDGAQLTHGVLLSKMPEWPTFRRLRHDSSPEITALLSNKLPAVYAFINEVFFRHDIYPVDWEGNLHISCKDSSQDAFYFIDFDFFADLERCAARTSDPPLTKEQVIADFNALFQYKYGVSPSTG